LPLRVPFSFGRGDPEQGIRTLHRLAWFSDYLGVELIPPPAHLRVLVLVG
jgi:hypothetical protein